MFVQQHFTVKKKKKESRQAQLFLLCSLQPITSSSYLIRTQRTPLLDTTQWAVFWQLSESPSAAQPCRVFVAGCATMIYAFVPVNKQKGVAEDGLLFSLLNKCCEQRFCIWMSSGQPVIKQQTLC